MGFKGTATAGAADAYMPPPGNHVARMIAALNLGWHEEVFKDAKTQSERRSWVEKVLFVWQLTGAEPPGVVFKCFTLVFSPKAGLRLLMEKLRGRAYQEGEDIDPLKMLGHPCLVSITHRTSAGGKAYAKVDGVGPVPAGLTVPPATFEPIIWELGNGPFPSAPWLPGYLYGEKISDLLVRAKTAKPAAPMVANGAPQTPASVPANGAVRQDTPAAPAAAATGDVPF
jgi:hypothetical protein